METIIAIPVFVLLLLLEFFYMRKKQKHYYRLNDAITNLNIGIGHVISKVIVGLFLIWIYDLVYSHRIVTLPNNIFTIVFCLFAYDFFFYWAHRVGHEMNFFWGAHGVHHQSEDYNLSVALRQSWLHASIAFFIFLPIPFLGVSPKVFFPILALNSFYQFWIHTDVINRMPKWFEFLFNAPAHHRVHHGRNPKYIDKNHAGMFIIWDKLFGTFQEEEEKPTYGITKPLNSWNPFFANIEYYLSMFKMSKLMKSKDKLKLIFAKPGWQPDYLGGQIAVPEVEQTIQKYDVKPRTNGINIYVLVQFVFIILGLMAYLYYYDTLPLFHKIFWFAMVMLSILSSSAIIEQKNWARYVEIIRLIIIVVGLNVLYFSNYYNWAIVTAIISIPTTLYFIVWYLLNLKDKYIFGFMSKQTV